MKKWQLEQRWRWWHPSDARLLSLQDGEMNDRSSARTRVHLQQCSYCRTRAAQIADELKNIAILNAALNPADVLSQEEFTKKIQASIHERLPAPSGTSPAQWREGLTQIDARRQVAAVLETYLGRRATSVILRKNTSTPVSEKRSLEQVWPVLSTLLGRKSATALETKLLRMAGQFPKSSGSSSVR